MYVDTAVLVKVLVAETDSSYYASLLEAADDLWSSELLVTEMCSALLRKEREGSVTRAARRAAGRQLRHYIVDGSLRLVPLTRGLLEKAGGMLETCHPSTPLRSLDAIHLASFAQCGSGPLAATDRILRAAAGLLGFPLTALAPGARDRQG